MKIFDALVKSPDTALSRHGGIIAAYKQVRFIPSDSRALSAAFFRARPKIGRFSTFYGAIKYLTRS